MHREYRLVLEDCKILQMAWRGWFCHERAAVCSAVLGAMPLNDVYFRHQSSQINPTERNCLCFIIKHGLSHSSKYFCFYSSSNSMPAMTKKDYLFTKFLKMGIKQLNKKKCSSCYPLGFDWLCFQILNKLFCFSSLGTAHHFVMNSYSFRF